MDWQREGIGHIVILVQQSNHAPASAINFLKLRPTMTMYVVDSSRLSVRCKPKIENPISRPSTSCNGATVDRRSRNLSMRPNVIIIRSVDDCDVRLRDANPTGNREN